MAAYEILLLNTAIPQIQAAQSGDTYVVPRDIAFSTVANLANGTNLLPSLTFSSDTNTGIYREGADALGFTAGGGTNQMVLTSTGLGIGTSSPGVKLEVVAPSGDNVIALFRSGDATAANNAGGGFRSISSATAASRVAQVWLDADGANLSGGDYFYIQKNGNSGTADIVQYSNSAMTFATNAAERARITSDGYALFSGLTTSLGNYWVQIKNTNSSSNCLYLENASSNDRGILILKHDQAAGATTGAMLVFINSSGTTVGSITSSNTATAYNTSSDYRLKDNQQPLTGSGAFIDALKPKTWEWKADGSKGVGFIAHEVQAISPGSVIGEKDGTEEQEYEVSPAVPATYDEDGNELTAAIPAVMGTRTVPKYQAMEYGSAEFIANIIAELQSLRARVAQLEGK